MRAQSTKKSDVSFLIVSVVMLSGLAGCAGINRTIPIANPSSGVVQNVELRIPNPDSRTQRICANNFLSDCLDNFWQLDSVEKNKIVFRYRRVTLTREDAKAKESFVTKIRLITSEGVEAKASLSERFEIAQLKPIYWTETAPVREGQKKLVVNAHGEVVEERGIVMKKIGRSSERFTGSNYVEFIGPSLITPQTRWVEFIFPGGLLYKDSRWRWTFDADQPINAILSYGPDKDRPDWATSGAEINR